MDRRTHIALGLLLAFLGALPSPARGEAARVVHVPPGEAAPGKEIVLEATVAEAWREDLVAHYRPAGGAEWRRASFQLRAGRVWVATIPAEVVAPPGVEYWIDGRSPEGEARRHFASAERPHRVPVLEAPATRKLRDEVARLRYRRARVRAAGEWIDFGSRTFQTASGTREIPDRYYQIEGDFTYRLLRFPLHSIRFGATQLLGATPLAERGDDGRCMTAPEPDECELDAGFRVGAWSELGFRFGDLMDVDVRGMVVATPDAVSGGGRGELRIGRAEGTHVAVYGEAIADVGGRGGFRLGWDTVPNFPMAATVEITSFPAPHRATAVRLLYDVGHRFEDGVTLGLRAGYQARDQGIGGVTLGASASLDFWLFE